MSAVAKTKTIAFLDVGVGSHGTKHPASFAEAQPISPADKIAEFIQKRGCEHKDFALELNISAPLLSMILQGRRRISSSVMDELERVTGLPSVEWQKIQEGFEDWTKTQRPRPHLGSNHKDVSGVLSRSDLSLLLSQNPDVLDPYTSTNLAPASIDLCLGDSKKFRTSSALLECYQSAASILSGIRERDASLSEKKTREQITIKPGDTWKIWTREHVSMPASLCGRVSARSELIIEGISASFGLQIDPLWKGNPFVLLTHNGDEPFDLDYGQPCVSLELRVLSTPYTPE